MAKGFANLYPTVCAFENLWYAYKAAVRGKRAKLAAARFEFHVEERLLELERQLKGWETPLIVTHKPVG